VLEHALECLLFARLFQLAPKRISDLEAGSIGDEVR
jgi:hypothetical protein